MERQELFNYLKEYYTFLDEGRCHHGEDNEYIEEFHPNYSYRNWVEQMYCRRSDMNSCYRNLYDLSVEETKKEFNEILNDDRLERREKEIIKWFDEKGIDPTVFKYTDNEVGNRQYYIWWYINNIEGVIYDFSNDWEKVEENRMFMLAKKLKKTRSKFDVLIEKILKNDY